MAEASKKDGAVTDVEEALGLFSLAGSFGSTLDLDFLLQKVGSAAERVLDSQASAIMLATDDKKSLFFRVASGEKAGAIKTMTLPVGQGIAGWVAKNRKPELVNDVKADKRFAAQFDKASGFQTRSVLCVPMLYREELVGVIEVLNKREGSYTERDVKLLSGLAGLASVAITNAKAISEQKNFFSYVLELLAAAIEAAKPGMEGHCARSARLACAIARTLGADEYEYRMIYYAGLLHDAGYLAFRNKALLSSMGASVPAEEIHPVLSAKMLEGIKMLSGAVPAVREHHERFDGQGFPLKLKGKAISMGGRILALVEAIEELRMSGTSADGLSRRAAELAKSGSGTRFDPEIVEAFLQVSVQEDLW